MPIVRGLRRRRPAWWAVHLGSPSGSFVHVVIILGFLLILPRLLCQLFLFLLLLLLLVLLDLSSTFLLVLRALGVIVHLWWGC